MTSSVGLVTPAPAVAGEYRELREICQRLLALFPRLRSIEGSSRPPGA